MKSVAIGVFAVLVVVFLIIFGEPVVIHYAELWWNYWLPPTR